VGDEGKAICAGIVLSSKPERFKLPWVMVMIELENITKIYRMGKVEVPALRGVTLDIKQGEIVAIIGASGSGKSTLMNIIGFLDKPTVGRYLFDGADVSRLSDNQLAEMRNKKVGFVFQEYNLLSRASALSNVELPLIYSGGGQKRKRVMEALERVGLSARAKHKPTELSGGEQQRVAIARALVNNPALILADEPTGNLDSATTAEIISIFRELNRGGITVVLVTHEMDIAEQTQRIIHLMDGKVISDEKVN
jgi:putative ABC transport system ATP-binding protein